MNNTTLWTLDYEMNCGSDNLCVDNLKMNFSFGSTNIEVGIMQKINVTVFVENRGENSYNTHFFLSYPYGLSYRRIMPRVGRVNCRAKDGMRGISSGETTCQINKPLFTGNASLAADTTEGNKLTKSTCRKRRKGKPHAEQAQVPGPVVREAPDLSAPNPEVLEDLTLVPSPVTFSGPLTSHVMPSETVSAHPVMLPEASCQSVPQRMMFRSQSSLLQSFLT
ncbi:integrin alpha-M-like protein [Labeo rohita]|uniref:Integrin alpha-M-like protein n=1 Tax=Labeo rohita TaxID=84645 RepID=A0A498N0T5_LABRO|nr:integrin alpha-M-like protein [Labeo rohita]